MDKQAILLSISCSAEERLLLANLLDRADACEKRNIPTCSRFLNEQEQMLAEQTMKRADRNMILYGGYEDAERKVALFLPDRMEEDAIDFSMCGLALIHCEADRYHDTALSHRDYLGALMAIGIARETVGDILIDGKSADLIVCESVASLIEDHLTSVGRSSVSCQIVTQDLLHVPQKQYQTLTDTVASLRLDCILASAFHLSRDEASKAVRGGRVKVNGREAGKPDAEVKTGDKIAIRGCGMVVLSDIGGFSKKGRLRITFKKPI